MKFVHNIISSHNVQIFTYLLSCGELDKKINTTLVCVCDMEL